MYVHTHRCLFEKSVMISGPENSLLLIGGVVIVVIANVDAEFSPVSSRDAQTRAEIGCVEAACAQR